jgi:hypothetical protein
MRNRHRYKEVATIAFLIEMLSLWCQKEQSSPTYKNREEAFMKTAYCATALSAAIGLVITMYASAGAIEMHDDLLRT